MDTQIDRQTNRHYDGHRATETDKQTQDTQIDRQTNIHYDGHRATETDKQTHGRIDRQTDKKTHINTDRQACPPSIYSINMM